MKLELKHLAGYLPYGLKAIDERTKEIRTVTLLHFTYDRESVGHNHLLYEGILLSNHLPILRPLSDLAKEIEVNRKKFVPKEKLWDEIVYDTDEEYYRILKREWDEIDLIKSAPYRFVQRLQEWHFDIYGLIENGLAIDINTL